MHNRKGRGLSAGNSSDDSEANQKLSRRRASPREDEDEEEEDDSEDEDDEDEDDDEPSVATEGAYDPAEYANLPVSTEIKDLFQYITR